MEALFLLIPLSLLAVGVAVWIFLRMNASGQFDDAEGAAWRVLMDDDRGGVDPGQEGPVDRATLDHDQAK
ncbi:MAG: cbb3-type cytochrome oxidase assembly protein CcoS [Burkholderiaceae bacterium]